MYEELNIDDNVRPHEVSSSLYSQMHTRVKMEEIKNEEQTVVNQLLLKNNSKIQ